MKPINFACLYLALGGALLMPALSQAQVSCTRGGLQQAVDLYVADDASNNLETIPGQMNDFAHGLLLCAAIVRDCPLIHKIETTCYEGAAKNCW